jgi:alpha-tubulin suppressor-like RCC1 family protein
MTDGTVRCWGDSPWNGVGSPSLATPRVKNVRQISTGDDMACALLGSAASPARDGIVSCWGRNDQGEVGREPDNDWHADGLPVPIDHVTSVTAGEAHACAIRDDGSITCWGSNGDGELGRGRQGPPELPAAVPGITGAAELALGADHACVLGRDHTIWCWGSNAVGQVGDGTKERRTNPTRVAW